jgi:hypothetical protein
MDMVNMVTMVPMEDLLPLDHLEALEGLDPSEEDTIVVGGRAAVVRSGNIAEDKTVKMKKMIGEINVINGRTWQPISTRTSHKKSVKCGIIYSGECLTRSSLNMKALRTHKRRNLFTI